MKKDATILTADCRNEKNWGSKGFGIIHAGDNSCWDNSCWDGTDNHLGIGEERKAGSADKLVRIELTGSNASLASCRIMAHVGRSVTETHGPEAHGESRRAVGSLRRSWRLRCITRLWSTGAARALTSPSSRTRRVKPNMVGVLERPLELQESEKRTQEEKDITFTRLFDAGKGASAPFLPRRTASWPQWTVLARNGAH